VIGEELDLNVALDYLAQTRENTLGLEIPANFIVLDFDDLKTSQAVVDLAKALNALMIVDWTPRGAHIVFEVDPQELLDAKPFKSGRTIYGEPAELFSSETNARVTFYGRHLEIWNGVPLKKLTRFLPVLSQRLFQQLVEAGGEPPWKVQAWGRHNFLKTVAARTSPSVVRAMAAECCCPSLGGSEVDSLAAWSERKTRGGPKPFRPGFPPLKLDDPWVDEALGSFGGLSTRFAHILRRDGFDLLNKDDQWWEFRDRYWRFVTDREVELAIRKKLEKISDGIDGDLDVRRLSRAQDEIGLEYYGERAGRSFTRKCRMLQGFLLDNKSSASVREAMADSGWMNPQVKMGSFVSLSDCVLDLQSKVFLPHSRDLFVVNHANCCKADLGQVHPTVY